MPYPRYVSDGVKKILYKPLRPRNVLVDVPDTQSHDKDLACDYARQGYKVWVVSDSPKEMYEQHCTHVCTGYATYDQVCYSDADQLVFAHAWHFYLRIVQKSVPVDVVVVPQGHVLRDLLKGTRVRIVDGGSDDPVDLDRAQLDTPLIHLPLDTPNIILVHKAYTRFVRTGYDLAEAVYLRSAIAYACMIQVAPNTTKSVVDIVSSFWDMVVFIDAARRYDKTTHYPYVDHVEEWCAGKEDAETIKAFVRLQSRVEAYIDGLVPENFALRQAVPISGRVEALPRGVSGEYGYSKSLDLPEGGYTYLGKYVESLLEDGDLGVSASGKEEDNNTQDEQCAYD